MELMERRTATIEVSGIELVALQKLSLVSHALASKIGDYRASEEQKTLAGVLDDVLRRIQLSIAAET